MSRISITFACALILGGCTKLERGTPLAVSKCGVEVGGTCETRLMGWGTSTGGRWAQGCKINDDEFCSWCAASGDPVFYPKGSRPTPADCKGVKVMK